MTTCSNCGIQSEEPFRFCPECGARQVGGGERGGDPLIGKTLVGRYRVVERIGAGSMGTVYRAEHIALEKPVAIKVLRRDLHVSDDARQRFQREGIAAGKFSHPNAIQIFDFEATEDGQYFLAMELVDGVSLKDLITERGALPAEEAVDLVEQLLTTLAEAHRHGVVHRDLKPENLMVVQGAGGERGLKVLDFGLSKLVDRSSELSLQTVVGHVLGTPMYMAPEQWRGRAIDARTDLYAVALILYELLAGRPPFAGSDVSELMIKTTTEDPPTLLESRPERAFPVDMDPILQRGLEKDPDARFQSAQEMLDALEQVRFDRVGRRTGGTRSVRGPSRTTARAAPRQSRRPGRAPAARPLHARLEYRVGGAAALVVVVGLAIWWAGSGSTEADQAPLCSMLAPELRSPEQAEYVSLLEAARDALRAGDATRARTTVETAQRRACVDAESFVVRAEVYRARGDDDTARADYREALSLYPAYGAAEDGIGWIHFDAGDHALARERFESARGSGDPEAGIAGLAALSVAAGEAARAIAELAPVAATSKSARVHYWLGAARLAQDDADGAIAALIEAKRRDSSLLPTYEALGDAYLARGSVDDAIRQYQDGLELSGVSRPVRRKLAELLLEQGRVVDASKVVEPGLAEAPDDASLLVLRALVAHAQDDGEAAIADLRAAISRDAEGLDGRARVLLGNLLVEHGHYREAVTELEAAAGRGEPSAEVLVPWGVALFRLDDFTGAASKLQSAVDKAPDATYPRLTLGVLYMDYLGERDRAVEQFEAYLENGGADMRVRDWLRKLKS